MVLGGQIYEMKSDPARLEYRDGSEPYVETVRRTIAAASA